MRRLFGVLVMVTVGASSCVPCACPALNLQSIGFVDGAGKPLTPLEIVDGTTVVECAVSDGGTTPDCSGNVVTYRLSSPEPHVISARATTGEVFQGTITPVPRAMTTPTGQCECPVSDFEPLTITLTRP